MALDPTRAAKNANEMDADTFDLDLYRLIRRAENFAADKARGRFCLRWDDIAGRLQGGRPHIRSMMSKHAVARTS